MKYFLIVFFLSFFLRANSQKDSLDRLDKLLSSPVPQYIFKPYDSIATIAGSSYDLYIREYINRNFHSQLDTLGLFGVSWTKFELDENGVIMNIESDPSTHPVLAHFIKKMLEGTRDQWNLQGLKSWYKKGMRIVLPIQYTLSYLGNTSYASQLSVRELNQFLNSGEQKIIYFLPTVEYISPMQEN